jgi:hypothetical protein
MRQIQALIRTIRPAALASFVSRVTGLSKRRNVQTTEGAFWVDPVSDFGWTLANGGYESEMKAVLERYLQPGCTFIDLGANEGYFSVVASRLVGPRGKVISVEPQSRLQNIIRTNLDLNKCANVRVVKAALSAQSGTVTLELAPDINTGGIRMDHLQADVFALDLSRHLSPLLAVHLLPIALRWAADCFLGFLVLLVFHANRSTLNSTWLGPVSETYSISPAGSGSYPFQDNAATIYTIANAGAMLILGQERSRDKTALAAGPRCASDPTLHRRAVQLCESFRLR